MLIRNPGEGNKRGQRYPSRIHTRVREAPMTYLEQLRLGFGLFVALCLIGLSFAVGWTMFVRDMTKMFFFVLGLMFTALMLLGIISTAIVS